MHSRTMALATVSRAPIIDPEVSRHTMIGPHSAAGRVSKPSTVTAGSSDHPTRSYDSKVRSARRAKCKRRACGRLEASSTISLGIMRDKSSERHKPDVCSGSIGLRTRPMGNPWRSLCRGARRKGPRPLPRPKLRTMSRNSFKSCSFLRSESSSFHPVCCHRPRVRSKPSGPSARSSKSNPSNALAALSSLSIAGSHCSLNSSMSRETISLFFSFARSIASFAPSSPSIPTSNSSTLSLPSVSSPAPPRPPA